MIARQGRASQWAGSSIPHSSGHSCTPNAGMTRPLQVGYELTAGGEESTRVESKRRRDESGQGRLEYNS